MQRSIGQKPVTNGHTNGNHQGNGATNGHTHLDLDVCVVGAGFAGVYVLNKLRKEGFNAKIVEAASGLGGIWHWNSYPGARVDSQYPIYALSIPEVYKTWTWSEQYPGSQELRDYFAHIDKVLDISKDVLLETTVKSAVFDSSANKWEIRCDKGTSIRATFFICCIGFAARRHFPDWEGLDTFKGLMLHSSFWPSEGVDVRGKKAAVVGTGATGIQIAQTIARDAGELTVFQRTPNLCCPMRQASIEPEQAKKDIETLQDRMDNRLKFHAGFEYQSQVFDTFSHTPEEREAHFEQLWEIGGFRMLANNYSDMMSNVKSNREAYNFWCKKTRARITDPEKRDILAPLEPPHPFGGKRLSLEQDFYEQMNKPNVHIVNIKKNPVAKIVPEGIVTSDGKLHELDIIALATGFDSFTGGLKDINPVGVDGVSLCDKWDKGTFTYLGLSVHGFPNMFFLYGPHAPTAYSNGPSCTEPQGDWVVEVLKSMRDKGLTRIDASKEAELEWKRNVVELHKKTLRDTVDSWYMGTNIPGKVREPLNYAGGIPTYVKTIREVLDNGYEGFVVS